MVLPVCLVVSSGLVGRPAAGTKKLPLQNLAVKGDLSLGQVGQRHIEVASVIEAHERNADIRVSWPLRDLQRLRTRHIRDFAILAEELIEIFRSRIQNNVLKHGSISHEGKLSHERLVGRFDNLMAYFSRAGIDPRGARTFSSLTLPHGAPLRAKLKG